MKSAKELDGATVCVQSGTTTELNLDRLVRAPTSINFKPVVFERLEEVVSRLFLRPLRRLHHRRLRPRLHPHGAAERRTTTSSCPR